MGDIIEAENKPNERDEHNKPNEQNEQNKQNKPKNKYKIQRVRFEIMDLTEQYLLFKKNKKLVYSLIGASILVFIFGIVSGMLLKTVKETNSAVRIGAIFSGLISASTAIGAITTIVARNYSKKVELNSLPDVTKDGFKPMFTYISDDILEKMDDLVKKVDLEKKIGLEKKVDLETMDNSHKEKEQENRLIAYYIKYLKRKNNTLTFENRFGISCIVLSFLYIILVPIFLTLIYISNNNDFLDHDTDRTLRHSIMLVGEIWAGFVLF